MLQRKLGKQGLEVPALGLGTMGMTGVAGMPDMYGPADESEGIATILRALDLGVNFFDTAEVYGPGRNEEILGRALAGRRSRAIIATKFGFRFTAEGRIAGLDSRPENVRSALEGCLKRLGTDYIDLWYQHRVDPAVPIEDTVGAMAEQVRAGKVRYLGLSEAGAATLRRAHAVHPISAMQSEYSLWERNIEAPGPGGGESVLAACRALGVGIVAYSPLGRGFLTGKIDRSESLPEKDYRRLDARFQGENFDRNGAILAAIGAIAKAKGLASSQIALAWLLHQGADIVPIPGTKRRSYLEINAAAAGVTLSPEELARLNAIAPTAGARYNERGLATIDR